MSTMELEVQKASLAREILMMTDENMINSIWLLLKGNDPVIYQQKMLEKRQLGILNGKAKVIFHDDWSMTPEELDMI